MSFGSLIGIIISPKYGLSLGLSIGTTMGMCIGMIIHRK